MESRNSPMAEESDSLGGASGSGPEISETDTRQALDQLMMSLEIGKPRIEQQYRILDNLKSNPPLMAAFFETLQVLAMQQQPNKCTCPLGPLERRRMEERFRLMQLHLYQLMVAHNKSEKEKVEQEQLMIEQSRQIRQRWRELRQPLEERRSKLQQKSEQALQRYKQQQVKMQPQS